MRNLWTWIVIAMVVIGGGVWWWQSGQSGAVSDDGTSAAINAIDDMQGTSTASEASTTAATTTAAGTIPMSATVTFNGASFSPSIVTIAKGGTLTFTSTGPQMWVTSNPHPLHNGYDGTTRQQHCAPGYSGPAPFDECAAGMTFTFTFSKTGSWGYHNHLGAQVGGTVIVQ